MTRILYWNLCNFSLPKLYDPATFATANESASRQAHIVTDIMRGPTGGPVPDIIVVVEVFSRTADVGAEGIALNPGSNAGLAVLRLLAQLRADPVLAANGSNWCLVPPLNLGGIGQQEAVAVFYNATTVQFTGPNLFYELYAPPGAVGQSQPVAQATYAKLTTYPAPWAAAMPALGRTTSFPQIPQSIAETQLAGEWQYYDTTTTARPIPSPPPPEMPDNRLNFPHAGCRGPFYTRFLDVAGKRTINLFSVHTSPATATGAVRRLADVSQITTVSAGEVNVLLGDFNVDTFEGAAEAYTNLLTGSGGIYTLHLDSRTGQTGDPVPVRKPYCMTHLLSAAQGTPYNDKNVTPDPQHNAYPRFGYMGCSGQPVSDSGAIDNILTAYGYNGQAAGVTVVNTLTGTPYDLFPAPPGVTADLTSGRPFPVGIPAKMLTKSPPALTGSGGITPNAGGAAFLAQIFQGWDYLGKRFSTSDHLPLMIDV
ncbi:hypothetical protein [Nonomuraea rhizosphaerae]|uniref:hypothetical protein n=1 Tax=Nonomuraea rhizosphaerae TaxID=2665663 RepID=UPI001C5F2EF4|nr:hypothetical protein [Nonomuraea rhizosphaerae]